MTKQWFKLICQEKDLQLLGTLNGGQSFRWKNINKDNVEKWIGVFSNKVWILQQNKDNILYQVYENDSEQNRHNADFYNKMLIDYFRLDLNLELYYNKWSLKDNFFKLAASQFYGVRILKQDLVENIFSFICSSNNNITRITGMIEKLCREYGDKICEIDSEEFYSFPKVEKLVNHNTLTTLKKQGFGYRAKYINESAKFIISQGSDKWLNGLKELSYETARAKLMTLSGIGPKVADCICLMSLGHLQAIPVDTHVYEIARKFYMPNLPKQKSVTTKLYKEIGDNFRNNYGPLAGWAHTVLFCADLKKFTANSYQVINQ